MDSLCLSTASILRCTSFTQLQVIFLIIPTAVEVVLSTVLVFACRGPGWRHLWLAAEGWIYFSLALVEMLSHILPAARDRADIFKVLDTVLAATSFVPIFCYMLFLFLMTRAEMIAILPIRFQTISKLLLLIFIPCIVTLNELASFVGISHSVTNISSAPAVIPGFTNEKGQTLWTFFTSITLALLTAYQAVNFSFSFYRLIRALLDQRRIEVTSTDEAHLFRGIGWITAGLKLGAIETVIGFAAAGFGSAMTRRIMRTVARGFLIIGLIKGLDSAEDFVRIQDELSKGKRKEVRRSRLRNFISNPRHSTFRQLSPTATAFHSTPRAPQALAEYFPTPKPQPHVGLPNMKQFAELKSIETASLGELSEKPAQERVTVHYEQGTPKLQLRFSLLEIPDVPVPDVKLTRPSPRHAKENHAPVIQSPQHISLLDALGLDKLTEKVASPLPKLMIPPTAHIPATKSRDSTRSIPESYTSAVRELVPQFPLPSRHTPAPAPQFPLPSHQALLSGTLTPLEPVRQEKEKIEGQFWDDTASVASVPPSRPTSTATIKSRRTSSIPPIVSPMSAIDPFMIMTATRATSLKRSALPHNDNASQPSYTARSLSHSSTSASSNYTVSSIISGYMSTPAQSATTADTEDDGYLDLGSALDTGGKSRTFMRDSKGALTTHTVEWGPATPLAPVIEEDGSEQTLTRVASQRSKSESVGTLSIPWLQVPDTEEQQLEEEVRRVGHKHMHRRSQTHGGASRIKSIGKAPMRSTPMPVKGLYSRGSLHIERILIPPKQDLFSNVEIVQGSVGSVESNIYGGGRGVLRDSEVLGVEDGASRYAGREGYF